MSREAQRKAGIAARNSLSMEEVQSRSLAIAEAVAASEYWKSAKTILSYKAVGHEVDLAALEEYAKRDGKRLCYPLCTAPGQMIALLPRDENSWQEGSFGIREPIRERSEEIAPEDIDLVLCPCTAYDRENHRMGMGGGYYDRYLPRCSRAHILAVAFREQECEKLDAEPWDVGMERIISN